MLRTYFFALCGLTIACAREPAATEARSDAPEAPREASHAFLEGLVGHWDMEGHVMGSPVRYRARGTRVLGGAWLEFHMIDVRTPPEYEARVFIAADTGAEDYVVHWLDTFGGAGARVTGSGHLR
jgi:hypothetical protein